MLISGSDKMYSKTDSEVSISNKLEGTEKNALNMNKKVRKNSFKKNQIFRSLALSHLNTVKP